MIITGTVSQLQAIFDALLVRDNIILFTSDGGTVQALTVIGSRSPGVVFTITDAKPTKAALLVKYPTALEVTDID